MLNIKTATYESVTLDELKELMDKNALTKAQLLELAHNIGISRVTFSTKAEAWRAILQFIINREVLNNINHLFE